MATGLDAGPWFSWMGGPHMKQTQHLGIWDAASWHADIAMAMVDVEQ